MIAGLLQKEEWMVEIRTYRHLLAGLMLGVLGSLILFGVSLTLSWRLASSSPSLKLIGLYLSSGVAVLAGGFIFTWRGRISGMGLPAMAGFFIGGISVVYILGPTLLALGLASSAAVLASLGALLYQRLASDRWPTREG